MEGEVFFTSNFLEFFKELAANNNKEWFDIHRSRYEEFVKVPMRNFVTRLIVELSKEDKGIETNPSNCIFRINRDVRFSKNKTPYKLHTSAVIASDGKKNRDGGGIYIELGPEKFALGGGAYQPDKDDLFDIRESIARRPQEFSAALRDKDFVRYWGELQGEKNKILPPEFKSASVICPEIAHKQYFYWAEIEAEIVTSTKLLPTVLEYYRASSSVRIFLTKSLRK